MKRKEVKKGGFATQSVAIFQKGGKGTILVVSVSE
jgi:hypothetical protein